MNAQERYDYWTCIVERWRSSGEPICRWCVENNINKKSFYKWRKIIDSNFENQTGSSDGRFFAPLVIATPIRNISITVNDVKLSFDESLLSKVIEAIK